MNNKRISIFIIIQLFSRILFSQEDKIALVENGLTEIRDFVFEDSTVNRYSIADRMAHYKVPSVSLAVINNGAIEWAKTWGYANLETKRPVDTNTLYQVASITKSVNGLGLMKLVEGGQLSLYQDIRTYLKSWKFPDNEYSTGKVITLKNLLSHTAGLSVHGFFGYPVTDPLPTIQQILDGVPPANNDPVVPIFSPGTQFEYSGGGSTVIRQILDDHLTPDYEQLMQTLVLQPLQMHNSTFAQPLPARYPNFASAHDEFTHPVKGNFYVYPEQAAGGLWSTPTDIAKFIVAVQKAINGDTNAILNQKNTLEMLTPVSNHYALGFNIDERGHEKYFGHDGENYGFCSFYCGSFNTGKGVVILTNAWPGHAKKLLIEILNSVATTYDWKDFYQPVKKKTIYLSDDELNQYVGTYHSEQPEMQISIAKKDGYLELTARRPERMYPVNSHTFFLASALDDECKFLKSTDANVFDTFEVWQGGRRIIQAKRKK